jgi:hypothetical protein
VELQIMDTTFKTTVNAGNVVTERILTDKCFNVQIKHETVRVLHYLGRLMFQDGDRKAEKC